jgi:catechol 2,3-dioxygenase-like lactoylglutathione lyase family enzyme
MPSQKGSGMTQDATKVTTHLKSISLPVADQDAAIAFYVGVLGFELIADSGGPARRRWVEVGLPGDDVHLALLAPNSFFPVALRLFTADAEAAYARVKAGGGAMQQRRVLYTDFAEPMFSFKDPDGNLLDVDQEPR